MAVESLGGSVLGDTVDVPGWATYRVVTDPDGNRIGLWKPRSSERADG